jgi:hypothetical protein
MSIGALPPMSRPHARLELKAWALFAVPNGVVGGAVAGVVIASTYAASAPPWVLAMAVALVTGAGPLANVSSIAWSRWGQGRDKVRGIVALQALFAAALLGAALAPRNAVGLLAFVAAVLSARLLWCGVITLRAAVWRANYGRDARTAFVALSQVWVAVIVAGVGAGTGWALGAGAGAYRWIFAAAAGFAVAGLITFARIRMRRQRRVSRDERHAQAKKVRKFSYLNDILRSDPSYRRYLGCLFVLGSGTLMATPALILILGQQLGVSPLTQVLITSSLPMALIPAATPFWARLLARKHAIAYRSINSRLFVAAAALALLGAVLGSLPLFWLAAVAQGIAMAGGMLGFSLGHNDFAPEDQSAAYLGVHVTLAGVRGLFAPLIGAGSYSALEAWQAGTGIYSLVLPLVLVITGALGFARFQRETAKLRSASISEI